MKPSEVEFTAEYSVKSNYEDKAHGLVAWWDTDFSGMQRKVTLTTSPYCKPTHWKQTVFYFSKDIDLKRGDILHGSIATRKSLTNFRELDIKISSHVDQRHDAVDMFKLR
jgi:protein arginine N-methyltransferase 1